MSGLLYSSSMQARQFAPFIASKGFYASILPAARTKKANRTGQTLRVLTIREDN
jgi:hypothetical protein